MVQPGDRIFGKPKPVAAGAAGQQEQPAPSPNTQGADAERLQKLVDQHQRDLLSAQQEKSSLQAKLAKQALENRLLESQMMSMATRGRCLPVIESRARRISTSS